MTDRKYHNWHEDDPGIDICEHCGMYRCVADPKPGRMGRPRLFDVEYSTPDGEVIAVNPPKVPVCAA